MTMAMPAEASLENISLCYLNFFTIIISSIRLTCTMCTKYSYIQDLIDRNGIQVRKENEKFMVVCSCSPQNHEFGHFRFLFFLMTAKKCAKN